MILIETCVWWIQAKEGRWWRQEQGQTDIGEMSNVWKIIRQIIINLVVEKGTWAEGGDRGVCILCLCLRQGILKLCM